MSNEDLLQILLPAVLGGVVVLGIIVTFLIRRRRGQQTQVLAREHLSNWTSQQKVNSLAAQGPQDKNHWPLSIDSAQKLQYGSPYGDSPYYEMETYRSPSPKRDDQSSPSSTYFDGPVYSVPPFSEGGPDVKDDWDSRKVSLQTRIENELARRRLEIKAVANLQRKRSEDSLRRRALESRAKAFSPTEVISEEDDAFEELESAFSPRTLRKSVPPTTVFAQSRPTTPRSIASPKKSHSRNNSGDSGSAKRTHSRNNSGNSGPSQQTHTRNGSADKIDSWRKRNTRPDPVPPAETIASSTPLQTPTSKISNSRTDRITEWISTPKDTPTRPETIIEPERRKTHSRKGSNESNRTAKQSTQRGPARLERSQDLLPQSSEGRSKDIDDSQSDALTSVSRNGAKQAALATKRNETLKRIKEEEAKQERGAMLTGGSSAPAGQNSAAVLLESMSELLDADSYMPKSFQQ